MTEVSQKIKDKVVQLDEKLNRMRSNNFNDLGRYLKDLLNAGAVEVGWRSQCGATHHTQKVYREWIKIIHLMKKEGFDIQQENVKHGNAYATNNEGFWNSIIYKLS